MLRRRFSESSQRSFFGRLCGRCSRRIFISVALCIVAIGWVAIFYVLVVKPSDTRVLTQKTPLRWKSHEKSRVLVMPRPTSSHEDHEIEPCLSQCLKTKKNLPDYVISPPKVVAETACAPCPVCKDSVGEERTPEPSIEIDDAASSNSGTGDDKDVPEVPAAAASNYGTDSVEPPLLATTSGESPAGEDAGESETSVLNQQPPPTDTITPPNPTASKNVTEEAGPPPKIETLVCFATFAGGGYYRFLEGFFDSSEEFLFTSEPTVDYRLYAFINVRPERVNRDLRRPKVKFLYRPNLGYPFDTMLRAEGLLEMRNLFIYDCDYVYFIDCDFEWIREVRLEQIRGDLVAARHVGIGMEKGLAFVPERNATSYEENSTSAAYIPKEKWLELYYFMGGFYGGKPSRLIHLWNTTTQWAKHDMALGIIPRWHDETLLNKYFYDFPPTRELPYDFATFHQIPRDNSVLNHRKKTEEMLGWRSPPGPWEP